MSAEYQIRLKTPGGTLKAVITDFLWLEYSKGVNEPGLARFALNGDHPALSEFEDKGQVEIWRRDSRNDIDWYDDFGALWRAQERSTDERSVFVATCPGQMAMLGWRYILYYAGTDMRTQFDAVAAETVLKTLVEYNATSSGTTGDGRQRTAANGGSLSGFTVTIETDSDGGNSIDWSCAWKNLLGELQKIARIAGGDFDLIRTGAATWEFRWYSGQRGTDRTSTVIFSLARGNMKSPTYTYDRLKERTVAVAAGQGQEDNRGVEVRTGADHATDNDIEMFVDARSYSSSAGLQAAADEALEAKQARQTLDFEVLQTPSTRYGKHYCIDGVLGDLVTARYKEISISQKIVGVTVKVDGDGNESIDVDLETV